MRLIVITSIIILAAVYTGFVIAGGRTAPIIKIDVQHNPETWNLDK